MKKLILLFLVTFFVTNSYAGDTFSHGLQGFMTHAAIAKLLGADKTTTYVSGGVGALMGMYPDLAGAYGNIIEKDNYKRYGVAHHSPLAINFTPAVSLHLWVDDIFHNPGKGWKPEAVYYECVMIVVETILMYYLIKWINA